jgi:hypothetical protein
MRATVRRLLAWGVVLSLLLPVSLSVVIGLAALLSSLGDAAAATACGRMALALGVVWLVALAATAVAGGIVALDIAEAGYGRAGGDGGDGGYGRAGGAGAAGASRGHARASVGGAGAGGDGGDGGRDAVSE